MYYSFEDKPNDELMKYLVLTDEEDNTIEKIPITIYTMDDIVYYLKFDDNYSTVTIDIPRLTMLYSYSIIMCNTIRTMFIRKTNAISKEIIFNYGIPYCNTDDFHLEEYDEWMEE